MPRILLNKSRKQNFTKLQLYGHLPLISQTKEVGYAGHYWRSKEELRSDVFSGNPAHGCASVGRPEKTYISSADTECNLPSWLERGCRVHRLYLWRGVRPPQWVSRINTKQSDGEVPVTLELWGKRSAPSLPLLPGPLWLGVIAQDRVLSMGQT